MKLYIHLGILAALLSLTAGELFSSLKFTHWLNRLHQYDVTIILSSSSPISPPITHLPPPPHPTSPIPHPPYSIPHLSSPILHPHTPSPILHPPSFNLYPPSPILRHRDPLSSYIKLCCAENPAFHYKISCNK